MNIRYFTCWLLGGWIAGSLFMILVATQNFRSVDRLLAEPGLSAVRIESIGRDKARTFLRYQVSEQNRWYFETWEKAQLLLGAVVVATTWIGFRERKSFLWMAAAMLTLLLAERFYVTPEIVRLGRMIDFIPLTEASPDRDLFWQFHHAYSGVELTKLGLGFVLAARMIFGR